jgi:hypothetical protein
MLFLPRKRPPRRKADMLTQSRLMTGLRAAVRQSGAAAIVTHVRAMKTCARKAALHLELHYLSLWRDGADLVDAEGDDPAPAPAAGALIDSALLLANVVSTRGGGSFAAAFGGQGSGLARMIHAEQIASSEVVGRLAGCRAEGDKVRQTRASYIPNRRQSQTCPRD